MQGNHRVERHRARVVLHPLRALEWRAAMMDRLLGGLIEVGIVLAVCALAVWALVTATGGTLVW